ncbi:MAG: efflux RND transporter periplasmic adaptor subunit [Pseudomonadota bacterium]
MQHLPRLLLIFGLTITSCSALANERAASVGVAPVLEEELLTKVTLVGSAVARRTTLVSAQVAGMVESISVDRGDSVEQGQELFHLDDGIVRFDLQSAQAQLAQAEAEVAEAQRKFEETQRLRTQGHVPQSTLDTAGTVVAIALARADERNAELGRVQRQLDQHTVLAPFAGTVVDKIVEIGQWIRSDSSVLQLVEMDPARIEVPVPEHIFTQLRKTAQANVEFESLPNQQFDAQVGALIPQGLSAARTFPVWLELDNKGGQIAPGMSAKVTLFVGEGTTSALFVPSDALVRRADGTTLVWRVAEDRTNDGLIAQAVYVNVGESKGNRSQVRGTGLFVGDLVVVRGNESLRPNQTVQIVTGAAGGQ